MTDKVLLAESKIKVGEHWKAELFGIGFNLDTIIGTLVAAAIVLGLAFYLRSKFTATGVPSGVQLFFEAITVQMRTQIEGSIGITIAPFVLPLAVAIFVFILISNWLSVVPLQIGDEELIKPPSSDFNYTLALALFVFIFYHIAGIRRRGGVGKHLKQLVKGHAPALFLINIIEEIAKPVSLSLRLFGNMFAGGILITLIAMLPWYVQWAPNGIWKLFDLFVGVMQAIIFSLLTIMYFGQSMELEDEHH